MELDAVDKAALREWRDRKEILDCVTRYCRGVDRRDAALARSAYHADAEDDHGSFIGPGHAFVDDLIPPEDRSRWVATQHYITNHHVEFDGDTAHAETYWLFVGRQPDSQIQMHGGRYVDRFERRSGHWAIAARVCVYEWGPDPVNAAWGLANQITGTRSPEDISYVRPLQVTRQHRNP